MMAVVSMGIRRNRTNEKDGGNYFSGNRNHSDSIRADSEDKRAYVSVSHWRGGWPDFYLSCGQGWGASAVTGIIAGIVLFVAGIVILVRKK